MGDLLIQSIPAPDEEHPAELYLGKFGWYLELPGDGGRVDLNGIHPYRQDYEGDAIRAALDVLTDRDLWGGDTKYWVREPASETPPPGLATPSQARLLSGQQ